MVTKKPRETQLSLPGMSGLKGDFPRVPGLAKGAASFARSQGRTYTNRGISSVRADPNAIVAIGAAVRDQQDAPTHLGPQMHASYQALASEINQQYDYLTRAKHQGGMGISVEVSPEDPYPGMKQARADVVGNSRLKVLATETTASGHQGRHPALTADVNDKFRAVHDVFGHLATGRDTSRHGEEAAVEHHAQMFSPEARPALFSELRGQNSGLIYTGDFPKDKPYVLPDWANQIKPTPPAPPKPKREGRQLTMLTRDNRPKKNV